MLIQGVGMVFAECPLRSLCNPRQTGYRRQE